MRGGFAADGRHMIFDEVRAVAADAEKTGKELAERLRTGALHQASRGKVFLVGAGPGDAGLITVKGLWCIRHADVLVYDYLASNALLNEASEDAELIYAGKRSGHHHMSQEEIQEILLEKAFEGKMVVRLKGGDPFIFGRGGEEALVLEAAEIPFEIVPGVSSAYSVPAYAGIPVTHRALASQVHFITGHEQAQGDTSAISYAGLAKYDGTLVFLMGIKRLPEICEALIENGKDKYTPGGGYSKRARPAVSRRSWPHWRPLMRLAKWRKIKPPGILIAGRRCESF